MGDDEDLSGHTLLHNWGSSLSVPWDKVGKGLSRAEAEGWIHNVSIFMAFVSYSEHFERFLPY